MSLFPWRSQGTCLTGKKPAGAPGSVFWGLSMCRAREREGKSAGAACSLPTRLFPSGPQQKHKDQTKPAVNQSGRAAAHRAGWVPHCFCVLLSAWQLSLSTLGSTSQAFVRASSKQANVPRRHGGVGVELQRDGRTCVCHLPSLLPKHSDPGRWGSSRRNRPALRELRVWPLVLF